MNKKKLVAISERWEVWRINEEFRYVGKLKGENRKAEIGTVKPPFKIVERMQTGDYGGYYPGFE
jgi:protocatechuate 3,4-dioxygenase beta subunit